MGHDDIIALSGWLIKILPVVWWAWHVLNRPSIFCLWRHYFYRRKPYWYSIGIRSSTVVMCGWYFHHSTEHIEKTAIPRCGSCAQIYPQNTLASAIRSFGYEYADALHKMRFQTQKQDLYWCCKPLFTAWTWYQTVWHYWTKKALRMRLRWSLPGARPMRVASMPWPRLPLRRVH